MPTFISAPDPNNPNKHLIHSCTWPLEVFHTAEEGMRLIQNMLNDCSKDPSNSLAISYPTSFAYEAAFFVTEARLKWHEGQLHGSYIGLFIIQKRSTADLICSLEFEWCNDPGYNHTDVHNVTLANDENLLEEFFGSKFSLTLQLNTVIQRWEDDMIHLAAGVCENRECEDLEIRKITMTPTVHVETDWDVLS